jgi:hypothetical protein
MMPTSDAISRRATGIWRLRGTDQDQNGEKESLAIEQPTSASDSAFNYDHVDGSFEFGGIRVRLVTYKSIPGVIQVNASKTIIEWNTLRILGRINIVGFNDNNPSISHWLPTNADDPSVVPLRIFPHTTLYWTGLRLASSKRPGAYSTKLSAVLRMLCRINES